jgi:competence protein ComEC
MSLGWIILILGMELLSFTFLATAVMILLIIFPKMLLSLAFWFSVLGVFYIFLILKYFNRFNKFITTAIISFGIFILMSPIVHTIFPITSIYQLYSPLLSLAFTIFYPISIGSHIVGIGYIFDNLLLNLLYLDDNTTLVKIPIYYGVGYIILSIGAVYSRWIFYLLFIIASIIIIFINF